VKNAGQNNDETWRRQIMSGEGGKHLGFSASER
jgi:hypothetical protein